MNAADMISIIIPTLNAESSLAGTLTALVPGVIAGLVREVIVVDGGSGDRTLKIAEAAGCDVIDSQSGRGTQMRLGASRARGEWLMFLHADTVLEAGWEQEVATFIERVSVGQRPDSAAAFRFALDDLGFLPRLIETGVAVRCTLFRLPYGDQGLLLPRRLYTAIGGFKPLPLMEDVDIIGRLGRSRTVILRSRALTSAMRYKRDGYIARVARNWSCLALYTLRVPLHIVNRIYG